MPARLSLVALAPALLFASTQTADAAVLAEYRFTGNSLASSDTNPDSDATPITPGTGLEGISFGSRFGGSAPNLQVDNANDTNKTADGNLSNNEFVGFTLTADAGMELELDDLNYRFSRFGGPNNDFPKNIALYASVEGGTFTQLRTDSVPDSSNPPITTQVLGPAFQGIDEVEFRFVFFNGNANGAFLDDIVLNGEVVPEPASLALLAMGGLCLLSRRRHA